MKTIFLIVSITLLAGNSVSQNVWQQTGGPMGGSVLCLAVDSNGMIYAGASSAGIYKSTNGGQNWFSLNSLSDKFVSDMAVGSGGSIFAATSGSGLYRSTDNGISWQQVVTSTSEIRSIIILSNGYIFAGGPGFGIQRSTNNGNNWVVVSTGLPTAGILQLNYDTTGNVYAAVNFIQTCLFRTTNFGSNWVGMGPNVPAAYSVGIKNNGTIFCGTVAGLQRSADNGQSWVPINNGLSGGVYNFLFKSDTIFTVTSSGVYISVNEGDLWEPAVMPNVLVGKLYKYGADKIYASSGTEGVLKTTDNGRSWVHLNDGIIATIIMDIAADKSNIIFAALGDKGIYTSDDLGTSWQRMNSGLENLAVSRIHSANNSILYSSADNNGIYRSENNGSNWTRVFTSSTYIWGLTTAQNNNVYICDFQSGVYHSLNNGNNWNNISGDISSDNALTIAVKNNGIIFVGKTNGVTRTTNNGVNWIPPSVNISSVNDITFDLQGNIYAAGIGGGVRRSTDDGDTWVLINNGMTTSVVYDLAFDTGENLFASTNKGIFKTTDHGLNWIQFGSELANTRSDAISFSQNGFLFAATAGKGVYKTITLTEIKLSGSETPLSYSLYQNYPNPFNPGTIINYELGVTNYVKLKVLDVLGKEVATLVNENQNAGNYSVHFDGTNLPGGIYFYTLEAGQYKDTRKMVLVK